MDWVDWPTGIGWEPGVPNACPPPTHPPSTTTRIETRRTPNPRAHSDRMNPSWQPDAALTSNLSKRLWVAHSSHATCCGWRLEAHRPGAGELGGRLGGASVEGGVRRGRPRRHPAGA